ncbi:hypothetical protein CspeluHIS016_0302750 [Cutaneotrichosporon spelunceum]|uniref:Uncharacterized protein n=1 Tax=Cutaneotrichosporon spelunceum TaxID=1672016 RepID=A0AAD3YAW3_9TREE|nr:hypothetical protein CspeluHIS016_0302750 [Cutaneotrichosporon spelunceum]
MTSSAQQATEGERFRRKHLSLMLGSLDAIAAFKAAVGTTPGRVHPNVVRAAPFLANRGPSRRIGTVVNTYALTLRTVNDTENSELEKLFFDENAILLPYRFACGMCADGRVKCFARRDGVGYVCAATNAVFEDDKGVQQWVTHWRKSASYDYCGTEAEWLADLDEVIASLRQNAPEGERERRWAANTNADQLVRAGVVGEKDLNHDAATPKHEGDESEPPRKRRHLSPDPRDQREVRLAPRLSNEGPHMWPMDDESRPRAKEYYYTLQGHLDKSVALIQADEAALGAIGVGLEQLDRRKAELHEEQKRLKIEIRDRTNEVRRMREEMLALGNKGLWGSEEGKRGNGP